MSGQLRYCFLGTGCAGMSGSYYNFSSWTSCRRRTAQDSRPAQTLEDWAHVYDGLSDEEIETIDAIAKARANVTRDLP